MPEIFEIYPTIEGETTLAGFPITIVRFAKCNLRCAWCDTTYALKSGLDMSIPAVLEEVGKYQSRRVLVTGGEPLVQEDCADLVASLCDAGWHVYVETNGSFDISPIDERAVIRLDVKPPSSGMSDHNLVENFARLRGKDEVKIAIAGDDDFNWALRLILKHDLPGKCTVNFTPVTGVLPPESLSEWILESGIDIRLNLQIQKFIHGPNTRRV